MLEAQETIIDNKIRKAMRTRLWELLQGPDFPDLSSDSLSDEVDPSAIIKDVIEQITSEGVLESLHVDEPIHVTVKAHSLSNLLPGQLFPDEDDVSHESDSNDVCIDWEKTRSDRHVKYDEEGKDINRFVDSREYMEFQSCVRKLDEWKEDMIETLDLVTKPAFHVVKDPSSAVAYYGWDFLTGVITLLVNANIPIKAGDTKGLTHLWEHVVIASIEFVDDIIAPGSAPTVEAEMSESVKTSVGIARASIQAFSAHDAKGLSCLLASKFSDDEDFDQLIYLLNDQKLFGLKLEEPSVLSLSEQILAQFASTSPTDPSAMLVASATEFYGLGGLDETNVLPEVDFHDAVLTTAIEQATEVTTEWSKTHPDQATYLQKRIARYLEDDVAPPFRPDSPDSSPLLVQFAGLALGEYYCQASKYYKHTDPTVLCKSLDRIFATVEQLGEEWKKSGFANVGMVTGTTKFKQYRRGSHGLY